MFFKDQIPPQAEWDQYERLLSQLSGFVDTCTRYLADAFEVAQQAAASSKSYAHSTVLLLVRHVVESIDGVAILVSKGSAEPCCALLRSGLEGQLGVLYILEKESERRGLAYQIAHAHRQIKFYRKMDPNHAAGHAMRKELGDDPFADVFDRLPVHLPGLVANLEGMLVKPEFAPVEQEWQRVCKTRNGKDPEWYSLYRGPANVRALAYHLKNGAVYEALYRHWSNFIHAGGAMSNIAGTKGGLPAMRPVRHPDGLETVCILAAYICTDLARNVVQAYRPAEWERFQAAYGASIRDPLLRICKGKLIDAPWK